MGPIRWRTVVEASNDRRSCCHRPRSDPLPLGDAGGWRRARLLAGALEAAGFTVHRAIFTEAGTAPIDNLYARIGLAKPNLVFAGHTDVVPPGNEATWSHPPFAGEVAGDMLYGRGAVDMKGGIACFAAAALDYLAANGGKPKGSISLLITGDEESVAVNGTIKLLNGRPIAARHSITASSASRAMSKRSATRSRPGGAARSTAR